MHRQSAVALKGNLGLKVIRADQMGSPGITKPTVAEVLRLGLPQLGLSPEVNLWRTKNLKNLLRGVRDVRWANQGRAPVLLGFLSLAKILKDGTRIELGLASARVVTTAFANLLVDALQDAGGSLANEFVFHGLGTGINAEAAGDTALQTELTTQYTSNSIRPTGTNVEGASANIYRSVATITVDAAVAATEHGLFNDTDVGQGTLMDRSVFSVVNLGNGDSLQATYELTCAAGG